MLTILILGKMIIHHLYLEKVKELHFFENIQNHIEPLVLNTNDALI